MPDTDNDEFARPDCPECGEPLGAMVELGTVEGQTFLVALWNYHGKIVPVIDTDEVTRQAWDNHHGVEIFCEACGWEYSAPDYEHGNAKSDA